MAARQASPRPSIESCTVVADWKIAGSAVAGEDFNFNPPTTINYTRANPTISIPLNVLEDAEREEPKVVKISVGLAGGGHNPCLLTSTARIDLVDITLQDATPISDYEGKREPEALKDSTCKALRTRAGTLENAPDRDEVALSTLTGNDLSFYESNCKQGTDGRNFEPEEVSTQGNAVLGGANRQLNNVRARLDKLRGNGGQRGVDVSGVGFNIQGSTLPSGLLGAAAGDENELLADSRWGVFANGEYAFGKKSNNDIDTMIAAGDRNFDFNSKGVTLGVDYRFPGEKVVFGTALGYKDFQVDFSTQLGETNVKGYNFSAYGTYFLSDKSYFDAIVGVGGNSINSRRPVNNDGSGNIGSNPTFAIGKPKTSERLLSIGGGYEFNRGEWAITPYGRLDYTLGLIDGFTEKASHPSANTSMFHINEQEIEALTSSVGIRASRSISTSNGVFVPQASIEWKHEFKGRGAIAGQSVYVDNSGLNLSPQFVESNMSTIDRDYFNIGFGVSAVFPKGKSAYINVETRQGDSTFKDNALKAGFMWEF